ncbi:MAG: class II aldolase/adducin family protein [Azonexus sp.]|jgi:L-fuculose-phosphate aldolase|uniref:class II aldolase/adducin family protein n=1 Tax=Azonexus sp. TaxID=1872668 RepID=UPI002821E463|nr:class II aldolase/adducin family protein [Azonexus sp.]MDR0777566.1 class II aldolase/adducin family protein [Azonexus sp.]
MTDPRRALIATTNALQPAGLNRGTAGNVSMRHGDGFYITPTGMPYAMLAVDDIPWLALDHGSRASHATHGGVSKKTNVSEVSAKANVSDASVKGASPAAATSNSGAEGAPNSWRGNPRLQPGGTHGSPEGQRKPSSEWRLHRDLYATRPEVGAVLHAHSPFAVSLACLRRDIPPFHYMIARFGGDNIRCADYALFGSDQLSAAALAAMAERKGCLLANHGLLVAGRDLDEALALVIELEELCEQYWRACQLGRPVLLGEAEMAAVLEKFAGYGQQ